MALTFIYDGSSEPIQHTSDADIWSDFIAGVAVEDVPMRKGSDYVTFSGTVEIYSDVNHTETSLASPKAIDVSAIYQSLENIFLTMKEERLFLPDFGANLEDLLFEPMDFATAIAVLSYIVSAVSKWEPRVFVRTDLSSVTPNYEENRYDVVLYFEIEGLKEEVFELRRFLTTG